MLTLPEKIVFILAVLGTVFFIWRSTLRILKTIQRGQGRIDWSVVPERLFEVFAKVITFQPVFKFRFWPSLFHGFVAWAFIYYLLVNLGDVLEGFIPGFRFMGSGPVGNFYRLGADILSIAALTGMVALIVRRFILRPENLTARTDIMLDPRARAGIWRDSAIVGAFILVHVGSRFLGQSLHIAAEGRDPWQPFASAVAIPWAGLEPAAINIASHIFFWLAIGTILLFFPYFLYSKHLHLFFAPINFLLKPRRRSMGALDKIDFDDESLEQFGATHIEDLGWELIMDAYACIMCYRCQEVCPAYHTGKVLSPAAMEVNKRYLLNLEGARLASGEPSSTPLTEFAIPPEAVWACTACGACIDICPVGNEPMRDILNIRRAMVLMENEFPEQLQTAFRGMERSLNPWNVPPTERLKWAEGLSVPTIDQNPDPDILWWVGCAPSTDVRAQKTARAFVEILNSAGVNYAVLGQHEQCNGDSARRAGNEFLFNELASANVEMLNELKPKRIVTTCPHCLHTIGKEYPDFGGKYEVIHHTTLINELITAGRLKFKPGSNEKLTFHDPCYLGRQNDVLIDPRQVLQSVSPDFVELPRSGRKSYCCGAGGAQMWKEEEEGVERVNENRFREAQASGASTLAVGCPFCMVMLNDAKNAANSEMEVLDVAEVIAKALDK